MVYLIGGSSHVGKTLLAQKLMERRNIPYLSLDHIKMGFIRSGMTELTVEDDYKLRYWMWPFVSELIKTVCENDQELLIEGCYIPAEWKESFTEEYLNKIRSAFIVMDEDYLRESFDVVAEKANAIEKRLCDKPELERLIRCSREFKAEAEKNGIPVVEIRDYFDADELADELERILMPPKQGKRRIAVRYQSRGGNTKTMAETIAACLGVEAYPVYEPVDERVDELILCGGTYAFNADDLMLRSIAELDPALIGEAVLAVTASGTAHGINSMRKALKMRGIAVSERSLLLKLKGQGLALLGRTGGFLTEEQLNETRAFAWSI